MAPGEFYGAAGARFVRIALTETDERIDAAVAASMAIDRVLYLNLGRIPA